MKYNLIIQIANMTKEKLFDIDVEDDYENEYDDFCESDEVLKSLPHKVLSNPY